MLFPRITRNITHGMPNDAPKRHFWRMLNAVFNRPDKNRIKEVGPDRACAEWLLRCGAHVRWMDSDKFHTDYNTLPGSNYAMYKIAEVNADEAAVMDIGFSHFEGCKHITKARFHHCPYLEDSAVKQLVRLKDSLQALEITSCGDVSEAGLSEFTQLHLLESLVLCDLPNVRNKDGILQKLQQALPNCSIDYKDLTTKDA